MARTYKGVNAIDGSELPGEFTLTEIADVDAILTESHQAFWKFQEISKEERASLLLHIAEAIENLGDQLIQRAMAETGLPASRMRAELQRTVNQFKNFSRVIHQGDWVEASINTGNNQRVDLRKQLEPIGPVVVFGASNFPLAYSAGGGDTASALAAGCSVIVKAHPAHPGTSQMVADAIQYSIKEMSLPKGLYQHVHDTGFELGKALVRHPLTAAVGFTGSLSGGRAIFDLAAARENPIPVYAEMGSTNPILFLDEAFKENGVDFWARKFSQSLTLNCGQFCTNPGLMIAIESEGMRLFRAKMVEFVRAYEAELMLHEGISQAYKDHKIRLQQQSNATFYYEGNTENDRYAAPVLATASAKEFIQNPQLHEEVFGPYSLMVLCENKSQRSKVLNHLRGQLTGTVLGSSDDFNREKETIHLLKSKVGRLIYNGVPTGVEVNGSMHHGGPYPSTTNAFFSAVGDDAIKRFTRPVAYQNCPDAVLPDALKNENPQKIIRRVNGTYSEASLK
jgi:NADP-dependent aldehyde dehydrogenase